MSNQKAVTVSGYFNSINKVHQDYFKNVKDLDDKLFVIVNDDHQIELKGRRKFQDENERMITFSTIKMITEQFGVEFDLRFSNGGEKNNIISEGFVCDQLNVPLID